MADLVLAGFRRTRLSRLGARIAVVLALGWAPVVVLGAAERWLTGRLDPVLLDLATHARLLLAAPLLLAAEAALAGACRRALDRLTDEEYVPPADRPRLDRLLAHAERLRRSPVAELALVAASAAVGLATVVGWLHPSGALRSLAGTQRSLAWLWFAAIGLPLFNFLFWRSLWRWAIWVRLLYGLAGLPLQLEAAHPDRRGGVAFLKVPSLVMFVVFLFAASSVLCASWASQIILAGAPLAGFKPIFFAFVAFGELLAFGPLLLLTPRLFLTAREGLRRYGGLATDCVRLFRRRWLRPAPRADLLSSPDSSSLADLGATYRESVEKMSVFLIGPKDLIALAGVMMVPAIPLLLLEMPVAEVLAKLGGILLGARTPG
jgi:hypothetical protein